MGLNNIYKTVSLIWQLSRNVFVNFVVVLKKTLVCLILKVYLPSKFTFVKLSKREVSLLTEEKKFRITLYVRDKKLLKENRSIITKVDGERYE